AATRLSSRTTSRASKLRSTDSRNREDRATPPATRAAAIQSAANSTRRSASDRVFAKRPMGGDEARSIFFVGRRKAVSQAAHRVDHVGAELLAQPAYEYFDRVRIAVEVLIVDVLRQLGARN